jgi:hypothetical protein
MIKWVRHVAYMGKMRNAYQILTGAAEDSTWDGYVEMRRKY